MDRDLIRFREDILCLLRIEDRNNNFILPNATDPIIHDAFF
jgi:hypothetical protein